MRSPGQANPPSTHPAQTERFALDNPKAWPSAEVCRLFAALVFEQLFGDHQPLTYAALAKHASLPATANRPQQVARLLKALQASKPALVVHVTKQGRAAGVRLALPPASLVTLHGRAVTAAMLAHWLGHEQLVYAPPPVAAPPHASDGHPALERELVNGLGHMVRAELSLLTGQFDASDAALRHMAANPVKRTSRRARLWLYLHEMRLLRGAEQWARLKVVVGQARRFVQVDDGLPQSHRHTLLAAADLSEGWIQYRQAKVHDFAAYKAIVDKLLPKQSRQQSANNLWVYCERYNLMSLALRRMVESSRDGGRGVGMASANAAAHNTVDQQARYAALRLEWSATSLLFNRNAMELASLGGNLFSLANYMSNRALLLTALADQALLDARPVDAQTWLEAMAWLAMGEDLGRGMGGGADTIWSAPFLLTIYKSVAGRVPWPQLVEHAAVHAPWFAARQHLDVLDMALDLAQPALGRMLEQQAQTPLERRFERQLLVMCRDMADVAQLEGVDIKAMPNFAPLLAWARGHAARQRRWPDELGLLR